MACGNKFPDQRIAWTVRVGGGLSHSIPYQTPRRNEPQSLIENLGDAAVLSVDVKAIRSDSKSISNLAGKKPAPGEVPSRDTD